MLVTFDEFIVICKLKGIVTQHQEIRSTDGERIPGFRVYRMRLQARAYGVVIEYKEYEGNKNILNTKLTDYKDRHYLDNVGLEKITACLLGANYV